MCNSINDCLNCTLTECPHEGLMPWEITEQNDRDIIAYQDRVMTPRQRYVQSDKGKEAQQRYRNSFRGQVVEDRKKRKKVESGRNAKYCRAWYYRKKAEATAQVGEGER